MLIESYLLEQFEAVARCGTLLKASEEAQEGAGCARLGVATGAFLASAPLLPRL